MNELQGHARDVGCGVSPAEPNNLSQWKPLVCSYILETHRAEASAASIFEQSEGEGGKEEEEGQGWRYGGMGKGRRRSSRAPSPPSAAEPAGELEIYEIGGGYGTNALCVLDYLQVGGWGTIPPLRHSVT